MARKRGARPIALAAALLSAMLILGYFESLLPSGVPGVKIGLSNSVLLFAVYALGAPRAFSLMAAKVLLSGFLFGSPASMLYAAAGGVLSVTAMALLSRVRGVTPVGAGIAGAVAHNAGQALVAILILRTEKLIYYMALIMLMGVITGALTGLLAKAVLTRLGSKNYKKDETQP